MTYPLRIVRRAGALCAFALFASCLFAAEAAKQNFNLPAGDAEKTLREFTKQAKVQLVFDSQKVAGVLTAPVKGEATPREALDQMFAGTGLVAEQDKTSGAFTVRRETPAEAKNGSSRPGSDRAAGDKVEGTIKLDTFEVMGTKLLNMDIRRSRDDAQPYVVFGRESIERSASLNLGDFLKQRLTMNMQGAAPSQLPNSDFSGNTSSINLRGLGASQTLVLIDGHRNVSYGSGEGLSQSDLNGIPLSAIERIEILPTTASGIYGGGATGGVVNVILRRDYAGAELKLSYENTFETDAAIRRADLSAGFNLEGGRTNVLFSASYADSNPLLFRDRSVQERARTAIMANNPAGISGSSTAVPPLGATTNIRSSTGVNLTLKNGTPLNSPITYIPVGYAGTATDSGAALVANAGLYNLAIADTAQLAGGVGGRLATSSVFRTESAMATIRRRFSDHLEVFVEVSGANNTSNYLRGTTSGQFSIPVTAPNNPFAQAITVMVPIEVGYMPTFSTSYSRRGVAGVVVKLGAEWKAEADFTYATSRYYSTVSNALAAGATTAVSTGAVDVLRPPEAFTAGLLPFVTTPSRTNPTHTTLLDGAVRAAGPVFHLPAGKVTLSGLLEYRSEEIDDTTIVTPTATGLRPSRSQDIASAYLETSIPLISSANKRPMIDELTLQLAARRDEYTVHGATATVILPATTPVVRATNRSESIDPTIGLIYQPVPGVRLRASYGTGFLPPNVMQLTPALPFTITSGVDPRRGNAPVTASFQGGGNPNLRPEESTSRAVGVVLSPSFLPGFRASLDYSKIEKTNNIVTLPIQTYIDNEAALPGRIVRGAVPPGDPFGVGPITLVDTSVVNFARAEIEAWDAALDYQWKAANWGSFTLAAAATWQPHFKTQLVLTAPIIETAGISTTSTITPKFKTTLAFNWEFRGWSLGWSARYMDSYLAANPVGATGSALVILANQGNGGRVASQVFHDVSAGYRFRSAHVLLRGLEVRGGIKNVFDRAPAFDASNLSSFYSYLGDPRQRGYYLSVKRSF